MRTLPSVLLFALLALFLAPNRPCAAETQPTDQEVAALARHLEGDHWYGLYLGDRKVGWQRESWRSTPELFCVEVESLMAMALQENLTQVKSLAKSCYSAKAPFEMETYSSQSDEDGSVITVTMTKEKGALNYVVTANGIARAASSPASQETLKAMLPWAHFARMQPEESFSVTTFDPVDEQNRITRVTLVDRGERMMAGAMQPMVHVKLAQEGLVTLDGWLNQQGVLLEGTLGSVFRLTAEEEQTAKAMGANAPDLFAATVIRGTGKGIMGLLVHDVERLVVKLKGAEPFVLPAVPRQRTLASGDRWVELEINACPAVDMTPPLPEDTQCNAQTPCDREGVIQIARDAVKNQTDAALVALELSHWVNSQFKYTQGGTSGTADLLLSRKTGDCSEFAMVFVLLARALGIPAREVTGIVLAGDQPTQFGYHAWVQVFLPERGWVDVDPTWNHSPVDATHIALGIRQELAAMAQFGSLEVEVEEVIYATTPLSCPKPSAHDGDLPPH